MLNVCMFGAADRGGGVMAKQQMTFRLNGTNVNADYDPSHIALGASVYVSFSSSNDPIGFSSTAIDGAKQYWVRWITSSGTNVKLGSKFSVPEDFIERVETVIEGRIDSAAVRKALDRFADEIRPHRMHTTAELERSSLSVVFTVLERLDVVNRLKAPACKQEIAGYQSSLISYLLLTCFDRLGQPADWVPFGSWLESSRHKTERDMVLSEIDHEPDFLERCKLLHARYTELYGVKSSFYRFVNEVLSGATRGLLFCTVEIDTCTYPPEFLAQQVTSDQEKLKYLFKRRNDYTHRAGYEPPGGDWLGRSYCNPMQEFGNSSWKSIRTIGWPDILEVVVKDGLAAYLEDAIRE